MPSVMQLVAAAVMLGFCAHLAVLLRPERHRALIGRNAAVMRELAGISPVTFARSLIPLNVLSILAIGSAFIPSGAPLAVTLGHLSAILLTATLTLVISITGRPQVFVLRPCRGASAGQVAAWLTPAPSVGVMARRRP